MKKISFVLFVFAAALWCCNAAETLRIIVADQPSRVVFPPEESCRYPAEFLQKHLLRATGKKVDIIRESEAKSGNYRDIHIGSTKLAGQYIRKLSPLKPEELLIIPAGKNLIICGEVSPQGIDRGTLFGVYEFLERQLGIRWFFAPSRFWGHMGTGTIVPKTQTVLFPEKIIRSAPRFAKREGGISYYYQKMDIQKMWHPVLRFGNTLSHENANHTQNGWTDLYADTHPEYFAKDSKGRPKINRRFKHRTHICPSNPDVLKQMMANLKAFDQGNPPKNAWGPRPPEKNCVYFAFNDGMVPENACQCSKCRSMMQLHRNYEAKGSNLMFTFITSYAKMVRQAYPEKRFATLAYSHYLAPPDNIPMPDNMDVTYVGPKIHYAMDPAIYNLHKSYLERWYKLLGSSKERLNIWMNIVNPTIYVSFVPFMYPNVFQKWVQDSEGKVSGYFINGLSPYLRRFGSRGIYGSVMSFPMVYLQARLLWDPQADINVLLRDYCDKLYGEKAGKEMLAFYRLVIERWENFYQTAGDNAELDFIHRVRYPAEVCAKLKTLLDNAAAAAANDKYVSRRLKFLQDKVYSIFFEESELYHKNSGKVAGYECKPIAELPQIDGRNKESFWNNVPEIRLAEARWGEVAKRVTRIKMAYKNDTICFYAELEKADKECDLRIQSADYMDYVARKYSPNIKRDFKAFREIRFTADGKYIRYRFPKCRYAVAWKGDTMCVEGTFSAKALGASGKMPMLRLQFLRYSGDWKNFEVWSPTMAGTTDYPTWRFGVVQLLASNDERDGLE